MRRVLTLILLGIILLIGWVGCSPHQDPWPSKPGKHVLATFPAIYCFAQNVAGDDAVVQCLLTSTGPHDDAAGLDEPDMLKFRGADLVLADGLGLEDNLLKKLEASAGKKVPLVKLGDSLPASKLLPLKEAATGHDPHVWLSPELAMDMVDMIADQLAKLDPAHKKGFHARAQTYKDRIKKELLDHGLAEFKKAKSRNIVTQHDAIEYFAHAFDLTIVGAMRQTDGQEIGPKELTDLIKECKDKKVGAVTCEPQFNRKDMETLCDGLNIRSKLVVVDPLETAPGNPDPDPACYLKVMRKNIDTLAEKLQ